ncbi:MAG: response regulator [Chloroflexi bacterium]|nr:response regulator [Chloroflexota bacterium]
MPQKILYIEDNPQSVTLISRWLTGAGYEFFEAYNGADGLAAAEEHQPDLLLIDINLPDMTGIDIVQRLRALPAFATKPLVALTANVRKVDREQYLAAGFTRHLPKPVTQKELLNTIKELIDA